LTVREFFYTNAGTLRAPWRIVLFVIATVVTSYVASIVLGPVFAALFRLLRLAPLSTAEWIETAALLCATAFCLLIVDKRPWKDVWMGREAATPAKLITGFGIGSLAIAVPIAALIASHWLRAQPAIPGSWMGAAVRLTLMLLPAALLEELATRGYVFAVLREAIGWRFTLVVTSIGFGLLHLTNPGATVASVLLVIAAGLLLGGIMVATRSLYAAWMAHFAWNWTMAVVFHTAVSGFPMESPGYRYVDAGPDWATGGPWGPEGGIPAGLGMGAGAAAAYLYARRHRLRSQSSRQMET
jgi:membrane protease YdiL (CAAX protease family)